MSATFLIQARADGKAWKTVHTSDHQGLVEAIYEGMTHEVSMGDLHLPRWPY